MESWRMSPSRSRIQEQQFVLKHVAAILVLFCSAVAGNGNFEKLFVIGDSYEDTGNRDPNNHTRTVIGRVDQPWLPPYGRTNPKFPAGRFSDGENLGDLVADALGLKPRPYRVLNVASQTTSVADGIVFAVGGAGVFDNLGFTKTGDQINQLKQVLNNGIGGPYTSLQKSLILYGYSGNDYATLLRNNPTASPVDLGIKSLAFTTQVVAQITQDLKALYNLGFRSFVVTKLPPLGCLPASTATAITGPFTACNEPSNLVATEHNLNLLASVTLAIPSANVIFLDTQLAFYSVIYNVTNPDPPAVRLTPCCTGLQNGRLCGDVDSNNNPQYTVCDPTSQSKNFFWDEFHPTEAGWRAVFNLFLDSFIYTNGKIGALRGFLGI